MGWRRVAGWSYLVGQFMVQLRKNAKSPKKLVPIHIIKGITWETFQRGCKRRTKAGTITPAEIKVWLDKVYNARRATEL